MRNKLLYGAFIILGICTLLYSCQTGEEIEKARYYVNGKLAYETHCQNCHGAKGEGLGLLIPPLTDTTYIRENLNSIAGMIKYGVSGEMIVGGQLYNEVMPAETHLTPVEIAYIINYIGNSFGNNIGFYSQEQTQKDLTTYSP